jgi:hypothetical protein
MDGKPSDQEYSERETAQRADAALRVALSTRPKPHSESKVGKPSGKRRKSPKRKKITANSA